jgi:hypothetical protein
MMKRRSLLKGMVAALLMATGARGAPANGDVKRTLDLDEHARRLAAARARAMASFPFERIVVEGSEALAERDRLKELDRGWPIVIGGDEKLSLMAEFYAPKRSPQEILEAAGALNHPEDLRAHRSKEEAAAAVVIRQLLKDGGPFPGMFDVGSDGKVRQLSPEAVRKRVEDSLTSREPAIGEWPEHARFEYGLSVAEDIDGRPLDKVHIVLLPTNEGAAVPAYLEWGGWNACPPPEYHVAALRSWQHRYGAELVGLSHDTMNLRVTHRPPNRDAALSLAREHFLYCSDIVWQGTGTLAPLAAQLFTDDWWYFWWD